MTRGDIVKTIQTNLADASVTYYTISDIQNSVQDAYNEIVSKTYCLVKSVVLNWQPDLVYYDFKALGVSDYLGTIAIFNIATNQWLRDDVTLRDFDRLRRDWEHWNGMSQFWASHSKQFVAVTPHLFTVIGVQQFKLVYWATAPLFTSDSDSPLIASDVQNMFFDYCTADLLESAEESGKAVDFWKAYFNNREAYKLRCRRLCSADLLLRV